MAVSCANARWARIERAAGMDVRARAERRLAEAGLAERRARELGDLVAAVERAWPHEGGAPAASIFVPGRLEVLGKHTDYAGGSSLLAALDRGMIFAGRKAAKGLLVTDARSGESFSPDHPSSSGRARGWHGYVRAVAERLARNFPDAIGGAHIVFASDLPSASGMSSSSALVTGLVLIAIALHELDRSAPYQQNIQTCEDLAAYLATVENGQSFGTLTGARGVGTLGGSEDHTAMVCAEAGTLSAYRFCPVRLEERVPVPSAHVFVMMSSGVRASKAGDAMARYNRAASLIAEALATWNHMTGRTDATLADAVASSARAGEDLLDLLRSTAGGAAAHHYQRVQHFLLEDRRFVPEARAALRRHALEEFGRVTDESQRAAEGLLGNQVPETIWLQRRARELGAVASSAFGAGFGGSVWALVDSAEADGMAARWRSAYADAFPHRAPLANVFRSDAGPCAMRLT